MNQIVIATPRYEIHRFVLPPFSAHVEHCQFNGGADVLTGLLGNLFGIRQDAAACCKPAGGEKVELPKRFIRLQPFEPAPTQRKHLRPGTKFVRIESTADGVNFADSVEACFALGDRSFTRTIFVVGGNVPEQAWSAINNERCGQCQEQDVVYILANTATALEDHLRAIIGKTPRPHVIGQIDAAHLAKTYPIQTDTSYERTIGEICRVKMPGQGPDPHTGKVPTLLEKLVGQGLLSHLIIRIGNGACVVISGKGKDESRNESQEWQVCLHYHPDRCAPTAYPGLGVVIAHDLLLAGAMIRQLVSEPDLTKAIAAGADVGVQATYRCFLEGFGKLMRPDEKVSAEIVSTCASELFARFIRHGLAVQAGGIPHDAVIAHYEQPEKRPSVRCPARFDLASSPNKFWRMVVHDFDPDSQRGFSEASGDVCKKRALGYLLGYMLGTKEKSKELPLVKIGKLELVDRHEVEDYLLLQRLLLTYHSDPEWRRPLSIGVFGQPGAGKSFGVKNLVAEMSSDNKTFSAKDITINLSQMRSMEELIQSFHRIRDACLSGPMPLVFFDEFDSSFEGKTYGWLKYFLAPMQDGEFVDKANTFHFGKAIFVFAGGVNHSFWEFKDQSRDREFCEAKGPDFNSRLRAKLDIKGMNMPDGDEIEHIYMIRRAVLLKGLLKKRLDRDEDLIAPLLAEAFLTIPRYKHGVRSLEAIIEMSSFQKGEPYRHNHLPPRDQLDIHVDARQFLSLAGVVAPGDK